MLFTQAVINFASNLEFLKSDWTCEQCGEGTDTPRYLVCDGKMLGPTKRKLMHLKELDRHEGDQNHSCQGSKYKDRLFIPNIEERNLLMALL